MAQVELLVVTAGVALVDRDQLPVAWVGLEERARARRLLEDDVVPPRCTQEFGRLKPARTRAHDAVLVVLGVLVVVVVGR